MAKYTPNGVRDSSFGVNGYVISNFDAYGPKWMDLQPDNKIVVAGNSFTDSGTLIAHNNSATLPITLSAFTATEKGKTVLLNWQTATELNNNHFEVQRSTNGAPFTTIGTVKSKGNAATLQQYDLLDGAPANGINYYRLKQVDVDGRFNFSKIVTVHFGDTLLALLYPNPVKDVLKIQGLPQTKTDNFNN